MNEEFYSLSATTLQGKEIRMEEYRGKLVLVVNTASKCGLSPRIEGWGESNGKIKDRDWVILAFR